MEAPEHQARNPRQIGPSTLAASETPPPGTQPKSASPRRTKGRTKKRHAAARWLPLRSLVVGDQSPGAGSQSILTGTSAETLTSLGILAHLPVVVREGDDRYRVVLNAETAAWLREREVRNATRPSSVLCIVVAADLVAWDPTLIENAYRLLVGRLSTRDARTVKGTLRTEHAIRAVSASPRNLLSTLPQGRRKRTRRMTSR